MQSHAVAAPPPSGNNIGHLRDLCVRLEDFAAVCRQVETAFASEDIDAVFEHVIRARHLRAAVERAQNAYNTEPAATTPDTEALMSRIAAAADLAKVGDKQMADWRARSKPPVDRLLASAEGVVVYTEGLLPAAWDLERDVVLLLGKHQEDVAEILRRMGQQCVIVFASPGDNTRNYPPFVLVAHSADQVYEAIRSRAPHAPERVIFSRVSQSGISDVLCKQLVDRASEGVRDVQISGNTVGQFAETWLSQGLANMPSWAGLPSIANLGDAFAGIPMLIVAPGPSLAKNIDYVKDMRSKVVLVAFSHTLSALNAAGIVPDVVITVDSNSLQYHFDDFPMKDVPLLINGVTVNPDLFALPAQRHMTIGANAIFDAWVYESLNEDALIFSGGSVATCAMQVGLHLKCDPLIFVGLDLSFPDGKYYIETSCDGEMSAKPDGNGNLQIAGWCDPHVAMTSRGGPQRNEIEPCSHLPGYHGGTVPTSFAFRMYHGWFERTARENNSTTRILNCTEGGAYIDGMEHLSLKSAADEYLAESPDLDVGGLVDQATASLDTSARRARVIQYAETMREQLEATVRTAGRCKDLASIAGSNAKAMKRLDKAEAKLQASLRRVNFISMLRQDEIEQAATRAAHATTMEEILTSSIELFTTIETTGQQVLPGLERAIHATRSSSTDD